MNVLNSGLYLATILIWGSTWLAITYQLGEVDPLVSVIYRMALASGLLFAWCSADDRSLWVSASATTVLWQLRAAFCLA